MSAGYQRELVEAAITRLLDLGMLDDEAFARLWVESRDRAHPRGERAIRQELARKGVHRAIVDVVLGDRREAASASGDGDDGIRPAPASADEAAAERLLERHHRALARVADPRRRRERAYALLARNGFGPDVCRTVAGRVSDDVPTLELGEDLASES